MTGLISLFIILFLSILITRVATVALIRTGLSKESARFQARSAFSGVGFTTTEAERVVSHPVRRRIVMLLMLLGNAGIVSAFASLFMTFINRDDHGIPYPLRFAVLFAGVAILWIGASSQWVDRWLSRMIDKALHRWTDLEIRDYAALLRVSGDYQITEMMVEDEDWIVGKSLSDTSLRNEGIIVIGIQRPDGKYVGAPTGASKINSGDVLILYGRDEQLAELDNRQFGFAGDIAHGKAVSEQKVVEEQEQEESQRGEQP
ncbi:MAG: TrkA C-terminal domain-containing protein [Candidatus Omnitrophica bacterium]|nr:TrkA C-terminal domain-containing protein [Candidatus Omnitrophota bacterium]